MSLLPVDSPQVQSYHRYSPPVFNLILKKNVWYDQVINIYVLITKKYLMIKLDT